MAEESVDLGAFVEAAGAGLTEAQSAIAGAQLDSTAMALSEATLVAKVALGVDDAGAVRVQTLDRKGIQSLGANATSLSTVTMNFVALTDTVSPPAAGAPPIEKEKAIKIVATRPDVKRLAEVLGPLNFAATFVPERSTWLVTASDETGHRLREVLVDKEA